MMFTTGNVTDHDYTYYSMLYYRVFTVPVGTREIK